MRGWKKPCGACFCYYIVIICLNCLTDYLCLTCSDVFYLSDYLFPCFVQSIFAKKHLVCFIFGGHYIKRLTESPALRCFFVSWVSFSKSDHLKSFPKTHYCRLQLMLSQDLRLKVSPCSKDRSDILQVSLSSDMSWPHFYLSSRGCTWSL